MIKTVLALLEVDIQSTLKSDFLHCFLCEAWLDPLSAYLGFSSFHADRYGPGLSHFLYTLNPDLYQKRMMWIDVVDDGERHLREFVLYRDLVLRSLDRVSQNVLTSIEILLTFGYQPKSLSGLFEEMGTLFGSFLLLDMSNRMETYLKFQSASYCARLLEQHEYAEMPVSSVFQPTLWLPGSMGKFLRRKMFCNKKELDLPFAFTICKIGKGMAPLTFLSVVDELKDHHTQMTTVRHSSEETLQNIGRTVSEFTPSFTEEEISLIASGQPLLEFKPTVPSSAACFEYNRQKQGCMREICQHLKTKYPRIDQYALLHKWEEVEEFRDLIGPLDSQPVPSFEEMIDMIKVQESYDDAQIFEDILHECLVKYKDTPVCATVVALLEPFKVRIITKAAAKANYLGVPLQKYMHQCLRRNVIFTALDRPLNASDMTMISSIKSKNPHWKIVSGDFKGATNTINTDATKRALGTFMSRLNIPDPTQDLLEKVVADQMIHYGGSLNNFKVRMFNNHPIRNHSYEPDLYLRYRNDPDLCVPDDCQQTNGQLMGSILSFPLLCIINASLFRQAAEEYFGQTFTMEDCYHIFGLLINGDDILYIAPQGLIDLWKKEVEKAGLFLSIGKNWVHPTICTINSQMFTLTAGMLQEGSDEVPYTVQEIRYLNWSLVHPDYDAQFQVSKFFRTCDAVQHKLLEGHSVSIRERLQCIQMEAWKPLLLDLTSEVKLNWFLPRELGGLGLETYSDFEITDWQRRLATYMATRLTFADRQLLKIVYSERVIPPSLKEKLQIYNSIVQQVGYSEVKYGAEPREDQIISQILSHDPFNYEEYDPDRGERVLTRDLLKKLNKWATQGCGSLKMISDKKIFSYTAPCFQLKPHTFEITCRKTTYGVGFVPTIKDYLQESDFDYSMYNFSVEKIPGFHLPSTELYDDSGYTWKQERESKLTPWMYPHFSSSSIPDWGVQLNTSREITPVI